MNIIYPTKWGVIIGYLLSTFFWIMIIYHLDDFDAWLHRKLKHGYHIPDSPTLS
ncbi:MAG: hypothetical protein ACTSPI_03555 [Candidatus Heimdallarchaeaceae archaeon]